MATEILHADEMGRVLDRLASQVVERHSDCRNVMLVGIMRRGADLATRLAKTLAAVTGGEIALGALDINLYRDDWTSLHGKPVIGKSRIPGSVDDKDVILVDDVLFTGRTIRSALEAIMDYGRPSRVELLVLVDRGHRELPIHADYIGRKVNTNMSEQVNVLLMERDGRDAVELDWGAEG